MRISEYTYRTAGPGLVLEHLPTGRTRYLQGDDAEAFEREAELPWKLVRWKKMGAARAAQLEDELTSQYFD